MVEFGYVPLTHQGRTSRAAEMLDRRARSGFVLEPSRHLAVRRTGGTSSAGKCAVDCRMELFTLNENIKFDSQPRVHTAPFVNAADVLA